MIRIITTLHKNINVNGAGILIRSSSGTFRNGRELFSDIYICIVPINRGHLKFGP